MSFNKICCLAGPRPSRLSFGDNEDDPSCVHLLETLKYCVETVLSAGYRHFICGMSQGVDTYLAELLLELKAEKYPDIRLECVIPCENLPIYWLECDRNRYYRILELCDYEHYISNSTVLNKFTARNVYMIQKSNVLLAAYANLSGGMRELIDLALKKNMHIIMVDANDYSISYYPKKR